MTATPDAAPRSRAARVAELAIPVLAVAVTVLAPALLWDRLPDPVASHWGAGGAPDGSLPRLGDAVLLALATAAIALGPLLSARYPLPRAQARLLVAAANGGGALLAGVRVASLRANLDVASWEAAGPLGGATVAVVVAVALLAGIVGWVVAAGRPELAPPTLGKVVREPIAPGEAVVWTGAASGKVPVVTVAVLLLVAALGAVVLPPEPRTIVVIVLPVVALAIAAVGQVRATVGPRGLTVVTGWFGWPRLHVPIEDVVDVQVEDVVPVSYGGWGLRTVPGATAVIVRRGEGLRVERRRGRALVVTVDGAARAAGVLLAHRDAVGR